MRLHSQPPELDTQTRDEHTPRGWTDETLEEICTFASGGTPPKSNPSYWSGAIPWASPKDLKVAKLRDTEDHISAAGLEAGSMLAPARSILVVVRGMILARDVPMALAEVPVAFNQDLKAVIPGDRIDAEYLLFAMLARKTDLFHKIGRSAHGTRTLLSHELARFTVPVAPIEEQKRIAAVLSLLLRAIRNEEQAVRTLRELREATAEHFYTRGVRRSDVTESAIGTVPSHWHVVPLGQHTQLAQYGLSVRGGPEGRVPILRMNCQRDGSVVFRDLQFVDVDDATLENFRLADGDLLFNRTNSYELVGRTAVFHSSREAVFASYLVRVRLDASVWEPDFVNCYLNRRSVQAELKKLASRGVSQANISASKLKGFLVPVAPMQEQRQIVAALAVTTRAIETHERRLAALRGLFATLLDQLMSGEIRVNKLVIDTSLLAS